MIANERLIEQRENIPAKTRRRGRSRDLAGELMGVSGKLVDMATKVLRHGSPELIAMVDHGELAVTRAAAIVKTTPLEDQADVARNKVRAPKGANRKRLHELTGQMIMEDLRLLFDNVNDADRRHVLAEWNRWLSEAEGAAT